MRSGLFAVPVAVLLSGAAFAELPAGPAPNVAPPTVTAKDGSPLFPEGTALPRYETDWERKYVNEQVGDALASRAARFGTAPPTGPIRCTAEFEPVDGIVMSWQPTYLSTGTAFQIALAQVITSTAGNAKLYLEVDTQSALNSARTALQNAGIDTVNKVEFVLGNTDSIWLRDYGPRYIYEGDVRAVIDHVYNRPRPNDDTFPATFATYKKHARYELNMIHGGGNFHLDAGTRGFATQLIDNENPTLSETSIKNLWASYQGLNMSILDAFPTSVDSTQHLDMWLIFVSPTKVLVSDWPTQSGTTQDNICDATALQLQTDGYTVYRLPARSLNGTHYTYANAMICNDAVAIPSYTNSTISPLNAQALAAWQEALPNHTITQVPSQAIVTLAGVMHCIVMHVPPNKGGAAPNTYVRTLNTATDLTVGQQVTINWSSDDDKAVSNVDILLSRDGGSTFPTVIASATADDGSFVWTVPDLPTQQGRLKVLARDADGNTGGDLSDANFIIPGNIAEETLWSIQ